jgi:hypothetical protein
VGSGTLGFVVGGYCLMLTPAQARAQAVPFRVLNSQQTETLEALGEVLVPGAARAGIAHFIDHQLHAPPDEQLLVLKYLGVEQPFTAFYAAGLAALDTHAKMVTGQSFSQLSAAQQYEMTGQLAQANPEAWSGPAAPLFYFALRNDALDVTYGTMDGFESLGMPYMAHIEPPSRWGA